MAAELHHHEAEGAQHGGHAGHGEFDPSDVSRIFFLTVAANLTFTLIEAAYAIIADSASLLADAGHNLGDVLGLLLAWGASVLAGRKASATYSYGYRRTTIMAAIVNALILVVASTIIAVESFEKLWNPSPIDEVAVIVVAGIGVVVNTGTAWLFMKGKDVDLNLKGAFLHLAFDALISVGVVITGLVILYTGWVLLDPIAGLIIVVIILAGTWGLLRDSVNLLLDAVPQAVDRGRVEAYLRGIDGVTDIHDVHIWGMSTNENSLTAHLVMPENTLWEADAAYAEIGRELERRFNIHHVTLQVEREKDCANEDCP